MIASVNNQPVRVEDVVEGGRLAPRERAGAKGVVVSHQTRLGMLAHYKVDDGYEHRFVADPSLSITEVGHDDPDKVGCIVLLRKGEATLPALKDIEAKVRELNDPASGRMLPGVEIVPYYDRSELTSLTTHTVIENLLVGIGLVVVVLLMFLNNVRTALIVAVNIPLALLFAFSVLYLRGKSANLLSIGAVDFGIIVDSSVIVAENIYRHLAAGENAELPLKTRIVRVGGDRPGAPVLYAHHGLCLHSAFCHGRTGRGPVRPHGPDLRLGVGRCFGSGGDVDARVVRALLQEAQAGS